MADMLSRPQWVKIDKPKPTHTILGHWFCKIINTCELEMNTAAYDISIHDKKWVQKCIIV